MWWYYIIFRYNRDNEAPISASYHCRPTACYFRSAGTTCAADGVAHRTGSASVGKGMERGIAWCGGCHAND